MCWGPVDALLGKNNILKFHSDFFNKNIPNLQNVCIHFFRWREVYRKMLIFGLVFILWNLKTQEEKMHHKLPFFVKKWHYK